MVTDKQVRKLFELMEGRRSLASCAMKANMDEKTARKYRISKRLPSELAKPHAWLTRPDGFAEVWPEVSALLEVNPGLQPRTILQELQRRYPGRFQDGQLRTLQRRVKKWRAEYGPPKEVYFAQVHEPGRLCASDFTRMKELEVTIQGQPFEHLVYHFVLTYSNWEAATICFSESFESLSAGLQNALWELGGVPQRHRSDRMSTAVNNLSEGKEFTRRYESLLSYYGLAGEKIQADHAHENGDIEQRHRRFKEALDQALMLRGSRDFASRAEYAQFLAALLQQLNAGRRDRLAEELKALRGLPARRLESCKRVPARVDSGSTIHVDRNTYSVPSRLIGERVEVRLYMEEIEVWYAQRLVERQPRLRGRDKQHINYRHIIDWLVRKPGAFAQYRYRQELFPSSQFRMAYDALLQQNVAEADREYLRILHLAAQQNESAVEEALRQLLREDRSVSAAAVTALLSAPPSWPALTAGAVAVVDLGVFDDLLTEWEVGVPSDKEVDDAPGREEEAGGVAAGTAPADDPERLRGAGSASGEGVAELRAVPAGAVRTGEPGAADEADRASAASVVSASGEKPGDVRPEALAGEAGATGAELASGGLGRAQGESLSLRESGFGENAFVVWACPGTGSFRASRLVHDLDIAGAGIVGGEARPETEPGLETAVAPRRAADRRPGVRAAKPGRDGGAVHAAGGALRARQRVADEQPAVLEVGVDLQGRDDDGGGDRPSRAPQRDPGVEPAELPSGRGQEEQGQGGGARTDGGLTEGACWGGPGRSGCGGLLRSVPAAKAAGHSAPQAPTPAGWTCGISN